MYNIYGFKNIIYSLKRRHGVKVTLRHTESGDFDADTGEQTIATTTQIVYKAVIGTEDILRAFGPNLGADYGGAVDFDKRIILIDKSDLPMNHVFTRGDQVDIGDEHWRIDKISLISNIGYFIQAEKAHE